MAGRSTSSPALRWQMFGARRDAASAPVAVIAIDEETHNTPPFDAFADIDLDHRDRPRAVGRARRRRQGRGLRRRVRHLDRAVRDSLWRRYSRRKAARLRPAVPALARGGCVRAARWCSARCLRDDGSVGPSPGQRIAVRQQQNIRPLNVYSDPDDIVRRVPLTFAGKRGTDPVDGARAGGARAAGRAGDLRKTAA